MRAHAAGPRGKQRGFGRLQRGADLFHRAAELLRGFIHRGGLVENVAAGEFGVRVAHHVAALGHAIAVSEPFGGMRVGIGL